jgi:beta-glucosidase
MNMRYGAAVILVGIVGTTLSCAGSGVGLPAPASTLLPYQNPDLPLDTRVEDLIGRMTLEEKVSQTLYEAPAIDRLGIPAYNWWNEALHGVARAGRATVFPQAVGLAATWDTDLMFRVARAISDEARAKYHESLRKGRHGIYEGLTFWSPNINIFRDPRWGRGMETYGEDPHLTGRLAVSFIQGMQGDDPTYLKTVATPKHYAVHSGPEPDRHTFDAVVDEENLWDTYLPGFRAAIVEGGAESIMCAYNRFRGDPACASHPLLEDILRGEWDFQGYVVSDCWAIMDIYNTHRVVDTPAQAAAASLAAGTDLNCGVTFRRLTQAVQEGLVGEEVLDAALERLFRARFRLGMFDSPERVSFAQIPYEVNDSPEHGALALEAALSSMVLLKNEGGLLPLRDDLDTVAVIGPNADALDVLLGNYHGTPSSPVTPLEGIRARVSPATQVLYAPGSELAVGIPTLVPVPQEALRAPAAADPGRVGDEALSPNPQVGGDGGLRGEYFANPEQAGEPLEARVDGTVDFNWWEDPPDGLKAEAFSVRWTGTLIPEASGPHAVGGRALGQFRLFVEDSLMVEFQAGHDPQTHWAYMDLEEGRPYGIRLEFSATRPNAEVQLTWAPPHQDLAAEAVNLARRADVVVLAMGLSPRLEGEEMPVEIPGFSGGDRTSLELPRVQRELMEAVVATGTPVVLVLLNGSALGLEWAAGNVPAILEAWYPGQAGGTALAQVLFGDRSPGGRLPVTFYHSVDQLPPFDDYDMSGRTYRYFGGDPVFPFGFGLSYTTFEYGALELLTEVRPGEEFPVSVEVRNTGDRGGDEVVQLYVTDLEASRPQPIRTLQGFRRVHLEPGEATRVVFDLGPSHLGLVGKDGTTVVEPGRFRISVGGKQPGFHGIADAHTTEVVEGIVAVRN